MDVLSRFGICLSSMFYRSRTGISSCKTFDVLEAHLSLLDVPIKVCFAGHIQPIHLWDNRRLEYIKGDGSKRRQVLMILISFKTYQQWFRLGRYTDHQMQKNIHSLFKVPSMHKALILLDSCNSRIQLDVVNAKITLCHWKKEYISVGWSM